MKIVVKEFYYINHSHDTLSISSLTVVRPILWCNKGLFCIISRQKVQNIVELKQDQKNLPTLNKMGGGIFHWEDGEPITARVAAMLLS
ncbi:unnamed protein product [marine sediment metagenome]|uniref:Uncharacterized protein n=1 Tax=marine sediment metagenome TaxID=412755 RepID=X1BWU4_9ZZZZ